MSKSETPKLYLQFFPISVISPLTTRPSLAAKPVSPTSKVDTQNLTTSHHWGPSHSYRSPGLWQPPVLPASCLPSVCSPHSNQRDQLKCQPDLLTLVPQTLQMLLISLRVEARAFSLVFYSLCSSCFGYWFLQQAIQACSHHRAFTHAVLWG